MSAGFWAMGIVIFCSSILCADPATNQPYSSKSLRVFMGFWDNYVIKNDKRFPVGITARKIYPLMASSTEAISELNKFKNQNITGYSIYFTGLGACLLAVPAVIAFDDPKIGGYAYLGGLTAMIAGLIVSSYSINHFFKAVWLYNNSIVPSGGNQSLIFQERPPDLFAVQALIARRF